MGSERRLLILACSQRKRPVDSGSAWELYDGNAFRVVKRAQREGKVCPDTDVYILSARHGLITPETVITHYDERMSRATAESQCGRNREVLEALLTSRDYEEVFIFAGRQYLGALDAPADWVPDYAHLTIPAGGIGVKLRALKCWVRRARALTRSHVVEPAVNAAGSSR